MALKGARKALELLARKGARMPVLVVSDSQYLVKGMRDWAPGWKARGWTRKGGPIENLELWQALDAASRLHDVQWTWARGHKGHPKNEYADWLAVRAAKEQRSSEGAVPSRFDEWLESRRERGLYPGYDPDTAFANLERRVAAGEHFPLVLEE
jgi:ribonuclease HI